MGICAEKNPFLNIGFELLYKHKNKGCGKLWIVLYFYGFDKKFLHVFQDFFSLFSNLFSSFLCCNNSDKFVLSISSIVLSFEIPVFLV